MSRSASLMAPLIYPAKNTLVMLNSTLDRVKPRAQMSQQISPEKILAMEAKVEYHQYYFPQRKSSSKFYLFVLALVGFIYWNSAMIHGSKKHPKVVASTDHVVNHLKELQKIATAHGESRSVINGHLACVAYVVDYISQFKDTWKVWTEDVPLSVQVDQKDPALSLFAGNKERVFKPRTEVAVARGSGSGKADKASLVFPDTCDYDFGKVGKPFVAVVDTTQTKPECTYCQRMLNSINGGASGIIFLSAPGSQEGYPHPMPPSPGRCGRGPENLDTMAKVAVVSLGDAAAFEFLSTIGSHPDAKVSFEVDSAYTTFISKNVLAETIAGDENNVVLFGSHLDGVPAGPGINDDGTGAMGTLELARALAESPLAGKNNQKIRLAFWTGEEIGLLGSIYYVKNLLATKPEELKKIRLTIDTDMIASPNYIRGVYDGTQLPEGPLKTGSVAIQRLFQKFFAKQGFPTDSGYFDGRSDYAPFMDQKIPSGGLFTGADAIKTPKQAELFGGISGVPLDPCYHQDCDRVEQLTGPGLEIMKQNMEALAYALEYFANTQIDLFLAGLLEA